MWWRVTRWDWRAVRARPERWSTGRWACWSRGSVWGDCWRRRRAATGREATSGRPSCSSSCCWCCRWSERRTSVAPTTCRRPAGPAAASSVSAESECTNTAVRVVWRSNLVIEREVASSSLTHGTVEYGPGQAAHAHLPLSPSSTVWNYNGEAVMLRS